MTTKQTGRKFAGRDQLLRGYREADVEIEGAESLRIRYKPPSARSMLKMQELGDETKDAETDPKAARKSWERLAEMVADHLVDENDEPLCDAEELMDAPMDVVLALVSAITPKTKGGKDEVTAQGEG